jgi:hypothetical protein
VTAIPVARPFAPGDLRAVLDIAATAPGPVVVSANIATGYLRGSRPSTPQLLRYLETGDDSRWPAADWAVGHFVSLLGTIDGRVGSLVLVADTYRSLGNAATYLQPIERVAAAIRREELATAGGVLVYAASADAGVLGGRIAAAGLEIGVWDNGSRDFLVE